MRTALVVLMFVHGLIHWLGFAAAFDGEAFESLAQPVSRVAGALWLGCGLLWMVAGGLFAGRRGAWLWAAVPALLLSQAMIATMWEETRFGTVVNVVLLLPMMGAALERLPGSYRNRYRAAAREGLQRYREQPVVTEDDLSHLPEAVRRYLRLSGAVGKPRLQNIRAAFTGRFRSGLKSPWMDVRLEQYNFFDEPARVFLMEASLYQVPMEGLHIFRGDSATMRIRVASVLEVVNARGPEMNRSETVTLFNDMCLLAPASLIERERIEWEADGEMGARARFTHQGNTIGARLSFNEAGDLTDFESDDRLMSGDGKTFESYRWSTPVRSWKDVGGRRGPGQGEAVWHRPEGEFVYAEFELEEIEDNVGRLTSRFGQCGR
jgi:hypothetical protein